MFRFLLLCSLLIATGGVFAQKKADRFTYPKGSSPQDFLPSTILVKVKPEHRAALKAYSGKDLVHPRSLAKARLKRGPRVSASGIDPTLYAEIPVRGGDVARFIDELLATGKFDAAEPIHRDRIRLGPNDPQLASQYYLDLIKAPSAWDLATGEDIVIGIVDSGGDLDHPDLASKIFIDPAEPIDGIDNDEDGYIDNNRGWDFMGADTLNINNEDFIGDNDPSTFYGGYGSHGTNAAGAAAAAVNNGTGIAGVGYQAKLLFTKHSADNQGPNKGSIFLGYSGLLYAATHGAKIINLSWGGPYRSQIIQDLITYITLDLDCLVIASAGNSNSDQDFYPAAYDHVLSVASSTSSDVKSSFSSYGKTVDIIAPGSQIFTTSFDDNYGSVSGTSFSAPIAAGAAALVWSKYPEYSAVQVRERLRVSADASIYSKNSSALARKLGLGRLDVLNALTSQLPALRASNPRLVNAQGTVAEAGDEAYLSLDFRNYLNASSPNLNITIAPTYSPYVQMRKPTIAPGVIQGGQVYNNRSNAFQFRISPNIGTNVTLELLVTYTDGAYSDYEYLSFLINPTYINIEENQIQTTVASNGRIGFENAQDGSNGLGFVYNDNPLLYEMGIMAGSSASQLYNNVRSTGGNFDQDFSITDKIRQAIPGDRSSSETYGSFQNNQSPATVKINYRSLAWKEEPYERFVIMEYTIKNVSSNALSNFNFVLFSDWDITQNGAQDIARWDADYQMGYIYPAVENTRPHAGIRILKGISPIHYAIDNNQNTPGAPFGLYDGFTDQEKITTMTSGIGRSEAGATSPTGADVSTVVGAGPYTIPANGEITVAFALMAADNLSELRRVSAYADTVYNVILNAPRPVVAPVTTCYGAPATLTASGGTNYKWYREFTGGTPVAEGPSLTTGNLVRDTVLYVANMDEFESVRTKATVTISSAPELQANGDGNICVGKSVTLTAAPAASYLWSNGETTRAITVTEAGSYSVTLSDATLGCSNTTDPFTVVVKPSPSASFTISTPQLLLFQPIQFTNTSTGGANYSWTFGNNKTSTDANPTQTYTLLRDYNVTLTVTNEFGCSSTASQSISIITGVPEAANTRVFPNPASGGQFRVTSESPIEGDMILSGPDGRQVMRLNADQRNEAEFRMPGLAPGVYTLRFRSGQGMQVKRVVVR